MNMELSNQKKLSEFYEELKRLKIQVIRPDINTSYEDFYSDGKHFYYALGAIKNVGFEAISNVVDERLENKKFKNFTDFIDRVNPKDINKLQLEGLVQAGAFDTINENRQAIYNSIPNIILKSKNIYENKSANQIELFENHKNEDVNFIENIEDWSTDIKLKKEFETLGFYISDHPLNQYKSIFNQYNIINYDDFENNPDMLSSNIACTVLKVQEKKTLKGSSYGIVKFSDLSSVFEIFIFSEIFENNRDLLFEGNSLMLTLIKNYSDENKKQKKINLKKILSLKDIIDSPLKHIIFKFNSIEKISVLKKFSQIDGETSIKVYVDQDDELLILKLREKRKVTNKLLNSLNLVENVVID